MTKINKFTRREFVKRTAVAGAGIALLSRFGVPSAMAAANSDPLRKWTQPLRGLGPTGIPVLSGVADPYFANTTYYQVTAGEFEDQLHPALPPTKLWGYWDTTSPVPVKRHLGGVIITDRNQAARLRITNTLPAQHIIPVDTTLPGANQAQNRIALHLHGGYVPWISDGGPFDWWTPGGLGYARGLSFLNGPGSVLDNIPGQAMVEGQADYFYPNDQSCRLMWYHDHAFGITRINAYAGLATGYLILDGVNDYYAGGDRLNGVPGVSKIPGLASTVPLVIQDKVFVSATTLITDPTWATVARPDVQGVGSLWYEHIYNPREFKLLRGARYLPPPDPSAIPEFFGDTMLCNGTVYPYATVEAKRYRFMLLNACNARFLNLNLFLANPKNADGIDLDPKLLFPQNPPGPNMIQIGTEGGFLLSEVTHVSPKPFNPITLTGNMLVAPAERTDFIIDFTGLGGNEYILYNDAPGPFPAGPPTTDYYLGNPKNPIQPVTGRDKDPARTKWSTGPDTRQILRFKVVPATTPDPQPAGTILDPTLIDPAPLAPYTTTVAPIPPLVAPAGTPVRNLPLNEDFDGYGRLRQMMGTDTIGPLGGFGREFLEPATEVVQAGSTEVWRVFNLTADTHPIHFHLVNVQILSRQLFALSKGQFIPAGPARGPEPNELGWKETVQMHPGEVTEVIMKFDLPTPFAVPPSPRTGGNEYVYHCHILEHEEHDMMRPLVVV